MRFKLLLWLRLHLYVVVFDRLLLRVILSMVRSVDHYSLSLDLRRFWLDLSTISLLLSFRLSGLFTLISDLRELKVSFEET